VQKGDTVCWYETLSGPSSTNKSTYSIRPDNLNLEKYMRILLSKLNEIFSLIRKEPFIQLAAGDLDHSTQIINYNRLILYCHKMYFVAVLRIILFHGFTCISGKHVNKKIHIFRSLSHAPNFYAISHILRSGPYCACYEICNFSFYFPLRK
jgi:hypothetical protein